MNPFQYSEPQTLAEAVALLGQADAHAIAGGSDLLDEVKEGITRLSAPLTLRWPRPPVAWPPPRFATWAPWGAT